MSGDRNRKTAHEQMDAQREFAQHGIRWKVEDAKAAGLHPLAAMGASGASFSPVMVGDTYGPAMAQAGQDISRAVEATRTQPERDEAGMLRLLQQIEARETARENASRQYNLDLAEEARRAAEHQRRMDVLELQHRQALDAASARGQGRQQVGPPFPSDLYGPFATQDLSRNRGVPSVSPDPRVTRVPAEVTVPDRNNPHKEAGPYPGFKTYQTSPIKTRDMPAFQTDSELTAAIRELGAYIDKWIWEWQGSNMYRQVPGARSGRFSPRLLPPN